jgi:hypothetical protein
VVDFFKFGKWLQKGSVLQQNSNLCHDPLIPHQSNSAREALIFQVLRKMVPAYALDATYNVMEKTTGGSPK